MGKVTTVILVVLALAASLVRAEATPTPGAATPTPVEVDSSRLRDAVTPAGILEHLEAFQEIADANEGTRDAGTPGYDASVDYVVETLEAAGYRVSRQGFTFDAFEVGSPTVFERISPDPRTYVMEADFFTTTFSGSGDVTAPLAAAGGILIPPPGGSASGCAAEDFAGFPEGSIALIQRGACPLRDKVVNAEAAEAVGVIIFNEGNVDPSDDRLGPFRSTLGPPQVAIPVVTTSFAVGEELFGLVQDGAVEVRLKVDATVVTTESTNVIADTTAGREDRTVVVGAHLDSVADGPGIDDNGTGSAVVLEVAEAMAELNIRPRNHVRFAFWGAEEDGLRGSMHYVASLSPQEQEDIAVNLNFDMLGSPNYVRFVYDGDGSLNPNPATPAAGPIGSDLVEDVLLDFFAAQGQETEPTAFDGRSDYGPFIEVGIPAGGLFSGAEATKTAREAGIYGGVADLAYDPCYHAACDSLDEEFQPPEVRAIEDAYGDAVVVGNVNMQALDELADGAAHATLVFAETSLAVGDEEVPEAAPAPALAEPRYQGPLAVR
jgi:Zn-dependent M28 family amino/carboxypeptidase